MELDLEQARRRAKERLRAARRGEVTLREDREPRLADAQRRWRTSSASRRGLRSSRMWRRRPGPRGSAERGSWAEALAGRARPGRAAAGGRPSALARAGLDVAVVIGDADAVAAALRRRRRARGARAAWGPGGASCSRCACHSGFLAPDQARAPGRAAPGRAAARRWRRPERDVRQRVRCDAGALRRGGCRARPRDDAAAARPRRRSGRRRVRLPLWSRRATPGASSCCSSAARRYGARTRSATRSAGLIRHAAAAARARRPAPVGPRAARLRCCGRAGRSRRAC